jgi:hypothetical protein
MGNVLKKRLKAWNSGVTKGKAHPADRYQKMYQEKLQECLRSHMTAYIFAVT